MKPNTENDSKVIDMYLSGLSCQKIGDLLGKTGSSIHCVLKRNKIKFRDSRIHKVNEDYFKAINTPEKDYWLGFIYADGSVSVRGNFSFSLWQTDEYALDRFLLDSGCESNKTYRERQMKYKISKMVRINVNSVKFCKNLIDQGAHQNKIETTRFPFFLPEEMYRSFLLGLLDGDGSINFMFNKNQFKYQVGFTGSYGLIKDLELFIKEKLGINCYYSEKKNTKSAQIGMSIAGALAFMNWIYTDPPKFFLHRKYSKFIKIVKILELNESRKNIKTKILLEDSNEIIKNNKLNNTPYGFNKLDINLSDEEKVRFTVKLPKRCRKTLQIDKITKELIKEWPSIQAAANELGISADNISSACHERLKSAYGYIWKFKD
jgi:hypothetical protein